MPSASGVGGLVWPLLGSVSMMDRRPPVAHQRGFTVPEILTALAIAAALSLVAAPKISEIQSEFRLSTAANQLGFEISRARMQAIGQNRYVRMVSVGTNQYAREASSDGVTYTREATVTLPSYVSVSLGDAGAPVFNKSGLATTATTFTLSRQVAGHTKYKTIQVSILGKVSIS